LGPWGISEGGAEKKNCSYERSQGTNRRSLAQGTRKTKSRRKKSRFEKKVTVNLGELPVKVHPAVVLAMEEGSKKKRKSNRNSDRGGGQLGRKS